MPYCHIISLVHIFEALSYRLFYVSVHKGKKTKILAEMKFREDLVHHSYKIGVHKFRHQKCAEMKSTLRKVFWQGKFVWLFNQLSKVINVGPDWHQTALWAFCLSECTKLYALVGMHAYLCFCACLNHVACVYACTLHAFVLRLLQLILSHMNRVEVNRYRPLVTNIPWCTGAATLFVRSPFKGRRNCVEILANSSDAFVWVNL